MHFSDYNNLFAIDGNKLIYSLFVRFREEEPDGTADDIVDACRGSALREGEKKQRSFTIASYKGFLTASNNQNSRLKELIHRFFNNDDVFSINLPSIDRGRSTFRGMLWRPEESKFGLDKLLKEQISIENENTRKGLIDLFSVYSKDILEFLNLVRERKIDYILSAQKRIEFLTTLFLAEREITLESKELNGVEGMICSPSGKHIEIDYHKVLFFCVRTNLSMSAAGGAQRRQKLLEQFTKLAKIETNRCYLITLDGKISKEFLKICKDRNIQIVTTKSIKNMCYLFEEQVITFEKFIKICEANRDYWRGYKYKGTEKKLFSEGLQNSIDNFSSFSLLKDCYQDQLQKLSGGETSQ